MTEASKQRMINFINDALNLWNAPSMTEMRLIAKDIYQAGMRDPDANAEKIANLERELGKPYDKVDRLFESNKKLLAENKKLREAMQFAVDHLSSMDDYSIVNGAIYRLREALSSEGEKL